MATHQGSAYHDIFTDPSIQEFLNWVDEHCCPGVIFKPDSIESSKFLPDKAIEEYFDCRHDNNYKKIRRLVDAATKRSSVPVNAKAIAQNCPKVFTILVKIRQPHFISSFVKNKRLHDRRLPFRADETRLFPKLEGDSTFFEEFNAQQWRFCVEKMSQGLEPVQFDDPMILPIVRMEELNNGAGVSALVHKIEVHADYDDLVEPADSDEDKREHLAFHEPHVYVVKSYHRLDAENYFNSEVDAFRKLNETGRPVPNLVGFYGAFRQNGSFNIILQYANVGTLEDYFQKAKPPKRGKDILKLWRNLFRLTDPLIDIHDLSSSNDAEQPRIFQGWHQDIKPDNILVAGDLRGDPYGVLFMLADLGLSHFTAVVEDQAGRTGEDIGGSRAYSSPEINLAKSPISNFEKQVKQKNDTWSLGCIYSEVNAWIVEGVDGEYGLQSYRTERQKALDAQGHPMGSCFHNHRGSVLEIVERWHTCLPSVSANQDYMTAIIWNDLLQYIFKTSGSRLTASQVQDYSDSVVKKAQILSSSPTIRRDTTQLSIVTDTKSSHSPPRTPPQIPPEYQHQYLSANHTGHPMTPPHTNLPKRSGSLEPHYLSGVMQSPDSLKASGSPPLTFENRDLSPSKPDIYASPLRQDSGLEGLQRPFSADFDHTKALASQGHASSIVEGPLRYSAYERPASQLYFTAPQQEISNEWQTRNPGGPVMQETTGQHRHHPSDASNQDLANVTSRLAELSNETESKGKERMSDTTETPNANNMKPQKYLSVSELGLWAEKTRLSSQSFFGQQQNHPLRFETELLPELKKRDHIFVIDDGESMAPHWPGMQSLFALLIYLIKKKKLDPNGSELRFIMSEEHKEAKDTKDLVQMVGRIGRNLRGESNFAKRLDDIWDNYKRRLESKWKQPRPISLYVLTDGKWQPGNGQRDMVARAIKRMVGHLEAIGAKDKIVGIQFIRFGNDEIGIERLRWLDADLKKDRQLARDICDTTSAEGNVWKMMLGSINDYWDDDPDD